MISRRLSGCAASGRLFARRSLFSCGLRRFPRWRTTVTSTNDGGVGSLRQAILYSNTYPGEDLINFSIPGPGVHMIAPTSELPHITRLGDDRRLHAAGSEPEHADGRATTPFC